MTLYFPVQYLKLKSTENAKRTIKSALKRERKKKKGSMKKNIKSLKRKCKEFKRDIEIQMQEDSIKISRKRKFQEYPEQEKDYKKRNSKSLSQKEYEKCNAREILHQKEYIKKTNMMKILNLNNRTKK